MVYLQGKPRVIMYERDWKFATESTAAALKPEKLMRGGDRNFLPSR